MHPLKLIGSSTMLALLLTAQSQAEVTGTVTATTDYDFRGVTQTMEDPALQGSVDWSSETGWYAGAWGSNVDFGSESDVEVDGYVGYAGATENGLGWDVGLVYYSYWPDDDDINFLEAYAGFSFNIADFKLWYANDYGNSGDEALYLEGNLNFELPHEFGLKLHAGHSSGDAIDGAFGDSYVDYGIGVTRSYQNFDFELKYVDNDIDFAPLSEGRLIFAVATTFPWSK